jgi:hypothetical protein
MKSKQEVVKAVRIMLDLLDTVPEGWQCPLCGTVHSPVEKVCLRCVEQSLDFTKTPSGVSLPMTIPWGAIFRVLGNKNIGPEVELNHESLHSF